MQLNLRARAVAALTAIFCLVFSQLATAAFACATPAQGDADMAAMEGMQAMQVVDGGPGSPDAADHCGDPDMAPSGLCQAHCNPLDLSLFHAQVDAPPVMLVALHPLADPFVPPAGVDPVLQSELPPRGHSPPLAILHCCFRI